MVIINMVAPLKPLISKAPFACLINRIFSTSQQCFSLIINQRTIFSATTFHTSGKTL